MIEILLVDDHPRVRRILRELIETYDDLMIVGEAVNGEEAVLFAAKLQAGCSGDGYSPSRVEWRSGDNIDQSEQSLHGRHWFDCWRSPHEDEKAMIIAGAAAVINKGELLQALHPAIVNAVNQVKNPV
jgi:CheY-like chemotaxis protein